MSQDPGQSSIFTSRFTSQNRYDPLSEMAGNMDTSENDTRHSYKQAGKRPRVSSSGHSGTHEVFGNEYPDFISFDEFQNLDPDKRLFTMFSALVGNRSTMKTIDDRYLQLDSKVDEAITCIRSQDSELKVLSYRSIDNEARQRRNNLIFGGHDESRDENCTITILNFLQDTLGIDDAIPIERAHRLGRFKRGSKRAIIVAFLNHTDLMNILSQAHKLQGTDFHINRDFPPEIVEARRKIWPNYKRLRNAYPRDGVKMAYPAKIIMGGKTVVNAFPDWDYVLSHSRTPIYDIWTHPNIESIAQKSSEVRSDREYQRRRELNPNFGTDRAADHTARNAARPQSPLLPRGRRQASPPPHTESLPPSSSRDRKSPSPRRPRAHAPVVRDRVPLHESRARNHSGPVNRDNHRSNVNDKSTEANSGS